jgi:hypothetical protein
MREVGGEVKIYTPVVSGREAASVEQLMRGRDILEIGHGVMDGLKNFAESSRAEKNKGGRPTCSKNTGGSLASPAGRLSPASATTERPTPNAAVGLSVGPTSTAATSTRPAVCGPSSSVSAAARGPPPTRPRPRPATDAGRHSEAVLGADGPEAGRRVRRPSQRRARAQRTSPQGRVATPAGWRRRDSALSGR